jgi:hypothetical protein
MADRLRGMSLPAADWIERKGDADFLAGDHQGALRLWQESTEGGPPHTALMLKLSDVFHLLGDLQKEREYREAPRPPPPGSLDAQEETDADLD